MVRTSALPVGRVAKLGDFTAGPRLLLLAMMALAIGVISAFVAYALLRLIAFFTNIAYFQRLSDISATPSHNSLGYWSVIVPVIGGLIVGLMARYGSDKIRGHGIPEAIEAILIGRSRMSPKIAILKPLSSAIVIGTGGPFGAEGPIIMTGGAFGSLFAQLFHLAPAERKTLLVAGAAAGMAAVFATPVAAVLLAVELLLFEWKPRSFVPVAVAALTASAVRIPLLGAGPMFPVHPESLFPLHDYARALAIGIAAGAGSCILTLLVYAAEDGFGKLPIHWMWWPAIGGLVVGVGGLIDPRALGIGYDLIRGMVQGGDIGGLILLLLVVKAVIWCISLGSGTSGGVLAPLLIIGGALGMYLAKVFGWSDIGLWAMIGMGAIMGGTMRAPFTASLFVLELTHDFGALPFVLCACIASLTITVLVMKRSILTEKVARRGTHVAREYSVDTLEQVRVKDVMDSAVQSVRSDMSAIDFADAVVAGDPAYTRHNAVAIVDGRGEVVGIVTRGDVLRALHGGSDSLRGQSVADIGAMDAAAVSPEDTMRTALNRMLENGVGRLIAVDPGDRSTPVGYVGRQAVLDAHRREWDEEYATEPGILRHSFDGRRGVRGRTAASPSDAVSADPPDRAPGRSLNVP